MSDRAFPALFPAIVSTWRAAKVRELREHAAKVRAAYTAPNITVHTFAYADALERAAALLADDGAAPAHVCRDFADGWVACADYRGMDVDPEAMQRAMEKP